LHQDTLFPETPRADQLHEAAMLLYGMSDARLARAIVLLHTLNGGGLVARISAAWSLLTAGA
jgi:hypothetical protein